MKLRLRSLESKETLKLDVPNPCSLLHLRQILVDRLSPPPGSAFRLSLNRTDELQSPNPADSLQSLGLASGDLVYYSLDPHGFASSGDNSSSNPNFSAGASSNQVSQGHAGVDSEDSPDLAGPPQEVADSEMIDSFPEDAQKVDVSGSTEKYVEEFGVQTKSRGINWKQSFKWTWEKKKRKREISRRQRPSRVDRPVYFRIGRDPNPLFVPGIIGGDYDRLPGLGVPPPFGQPFRRVQFRRNVTPNCNLGGLNG